MPRWNYIPLCSIKAIIILLFFMIAFLLSTRLTFWKFSHPTGSFFLQKDKITLLLWHAPMWYRRMNEQPGMAPITLTMDEECGNCIFTNDKNQSKNSDFIVLHDTFLKNAGNFPERETRSPGQKYVFWTKESPFATKYLRGGQKLQDFDAEFNLTMNYRRDSDIQETYGCWQNLIPKKIDFSKKTKLAVMIASDCKRPGAKLRLEMTQAFIKDGLKLDGFGKCFGSRFEENISTILRPYKFYMSFENSYLCREYITEKFWINSLAHGIVPVVWGPRKDELQRVAPPNSFIHVSDFSSTKQLIDYLNFLDKNKTAYEEYFAWRKITPPSLPERIVCPILNPLKYTKDHRIPLSFCGLCRAATKLPKISIVPSITKWWFGTETTECLLQELNSSHMGLSKPPSP